MGHSSLVGIDHAPLEPPGRDTAALGPSDSSDTGSDMAGIEELDDGDPGQPVDVAMNLDARQPLQPSDTLGGAGSDSAGTGERRSAAGDGGREGADISVDRVFDPDDEGLDDDQDLAIIDELEASTPQPGRPNPQPDPPEGPGDDDDEPLDDEDREERKPGRD